MLLDDIDFTHYEDLEAQGRLSPEGAGWLRMARRQRWGPTRRLLYSFFLPFL